MTAINSQLRSAHSAPSGSRFGLTGVFLNAVLAWCALPLSPSSVDSDFWGHVQYGRDTWAYGVPATATYAYIAPDQPWINHENLAELIFAWAADGPGVWALLVGKCALGIAILVLACRHGLRQQASVPVVSLCCVVAAINLSFYWGVRPHVFTFIYFGLLIASTNWCFEGWAGRWHLRGRSRGTSAGAGDGGLVRQGDADPATGLNLRRLRWLCLMPLLMLVWANTHGGFLAGLAVLQVILVGRSLELLVSGGRSQWRTIAFLACIALLSLAATVVNPYGIGLHRWLIAALGVPRPEIQEWHPPELMSWSAAKLWWLLGLFAIAMTASRRPRDFTQTMVLALVLYQAMKHQRHMPFVAILFLYWAPPHLESVWQRLRHTDLLRKLFGDVTASKAPAGVRTILQLGLVLLAAVFTAQVLPRLTEVPVERNHYPVSALEFMARQDCSGRIVVAGHWAQYVLGVMGARTDADPGLQVAFDGRFRTCYPQQVLDLHFDFFSGSGGPDKRYRSPASPPVDPQRILKVGDPQWVLLGNHHEHARNVLREHQDDWVLVYHDGLAQLWGRRTEVDDPSKPTYFSPNRRQLDGIAQQGTVPWPAAPARRSAALLAQQAPRQ